MVKLATIRTQNSTLITSQPLVAVFVGGTSGIGEYAVRALAATHSTRGKGLRVYIVGRNTNAAEKLIAECTLTCPSAEFRFVRAEDLALLKDVDRVCAEITRLEGAAATAEGGGTARVDLLVMSQAYLSFDARKDTPEGLDPILSLLYYSRMRFATALLPLLASPLPAAHIISVFGAGLEGALFADDLSLRDPKHYSILNVRSHVAYMTTLFFEGLAARHPGRLSLVHYFPSLVWTPGFFTENLPAWFRWAFWVAGPIIRLVSVPPRECGERVLFLAAGERFVARGVESGVEGRREVAMGSDGTRGGGAYAVHWDCETVEGRKAEKAYKGWRAEGLGDRVWEHTVGAFVEIEAGNVFAG